MARKKTKRKNRRKQRPLMKGGLLLLAGIMIGLFAALLVFLNHQQPQKPPAVATVIKNQAEPKAEESPIDVKEVASKYEFYGALPTTQVVVPENDNSTVSETIIIQEEKEYSGNYSSYMVQAGSFQKADGADERKAKLAMLGYEPSIEQTRLHSGEIVHRVLLGPFSDINSVNQTRSKLKYQQIESTILKSE